MEKLGMSHGAWCGWRDERGQPGAYPLAQMALLGYDVMRILTGVDRRPIYHNAIETHGKEHQMIVAVEELAECVQAVTKILRGGDDLDHLAEEIADATIVLEQLRYIHHLDAEVERYIKAKIERLDRDLRGRCNEQAQG